MPARLRLLKVIVQPVFVLDDGENLVERAAQPVIVTAADWPEYAVTGFPESIEALRKEVEAAEPSEIARDTFR
jgi:hypothetical protein